MTCECIAYVRPLKTHFARRSKFAPYERLGKSVSDTEWDSLIWE